MRYSRLTPLLIVASLLAGRPGQAQRAAIAPLAPRVTVLATPDVRAALAQPNPESAQAVAPTTLVRRPSPSNPEPLYVLNSEIIVNGLLREISPDDIKTLVVYKGADAPRPLRGLATYGILDLTLKKKSSFKISGTTLAEVGSRLHLSGPVSYSLNGMPVADSSLRIATRAIGAINITHATPTAPITVVDIQTTPTPRRALPPDPSGKPRIMIRGTASR